MISYESDIGVDELLIYPLIVMVRVYSLLVSIFLVRHLVTEVQESDAWSFVIGRVLSMLEEVETSYLSNPHAAKSGSLIVNFGNV